MTKEEIAMQLVSLYIAAYMRCCATADHKRAVAQAILKLGYTWEDGIMKNLSAL